MTLFPSPDTEEKPDSEVYKKYLASVLEIDMNLSSALTELLKTNKLEAANFADRVNKKEFKIATSYVLLTDNLRSLQSSSTVK